MSVIKIFSRDLDGWLFLEETAIVPNDQVRSILEQIRVSGFVTIVTNVD